MREFCNALKDAHSQYTYLTLCHASMVGESGYAPIASWPQYFQPLVHAEPGDIICESGLATCMVGDFPENITLNFHRELNSDGTIFGFEPVEATYRRLSGISMPIRALTSNTRHSGAVRDGYGLKASTIPYMPSHPFRGQGKLRLREHRRFFPRHAGSHACQAGCGGGRAENT